MLTELDLGQIGGGINLLDIGASGRLEQRWNTIQHLINVIGFEPNADECDRLRKKPHRYNSATFLPYAIGGVNGPVELQKTKSIYCYSVLKPNFDWVRRFSYSSLFELDGTERVQLRRLADVQEVDGIDTDVIKVDAQGLELPILSGAGKALEDAFYVETETGLVQNYEGETTYAQIDEFMRDHGFLLFDINVRHRIPRKNLFQQRVTGREQILWCEAVWLKDYVALDQNNHPPISRARALKSLLLCAFQECADFGFELAQLFAAQSILTFEELRQLERRNAWRIGGTWYSRIPQQAIRTTMRLLPRKLRDTVSTEVERALNQKNTSRLLKVASRVNKAA